MQKKGVILPRWTVHCGCGNWEWVDGTSPSIRSQLARQKGFHRTQEHGWLCSYCFTLRQMERRNK